MSERELREVLRREVVLIGDFHPDPAAKEWMHALASRLLLAGRRLVFGFELVEARYQALLDDYWQGRASEQELLAGLRYRRSWGLPWRTFRCLFRLARMAQVPCLALDDRTGARDRRDALAAALLHRSLLQRPGALHLVLFGEAHLTGAALPDALVRQGLRTAPLSVLVEPSGGTGSGDHLAAASLTPGDRKAWRDGLEDRSRVDPEGVLQDLVHELSRCLGRPAPGLDGVHFFSGSPAALRRFLESRGASAELQQQRKLLRRGLLCCNDPPVVYSRQAQPAALAAAAALLLFGEAPRGSADPGFAARVRAEAGRQLLFPSRGPRHLAEQPGAFLRTRAVPLSFASSRAERLACRWVRLVRQGTLTGTQLGEFLARLGVSRQPVPESEADRDRDPEHDLDHDRHSGSRSPS